MNIWITKICGDNFSDEDKNLLGKCFNKQAKHSIKSDFDSFEYKTSIFHYLSFQPLEEGSNKSYNYVHPEQGLTAYSGLLVGKTLSNKDFRTAESIKDLSESPQKFSEILFGHFSVIKISETTFQCFTDNKSYHNVYYFKSNNGVIYVSNSIHFIKLFKEPDFNYKVLLDWVALETILHSETEEKDIYMLPENGVFTWHVDKGLKVDKYIHLSDVLYSNEPHENLLHSAVSELRTSAEYLSRYHDCTINLSGGYDSRLVLSLFWGLDKHRLDCLTYADNVLDLSIAKKVARDHFVDHKVLHSFDGLPTVQELHNDLVYERFPFVKYSHVFNYLIKNRLNEIYNDRHRVILKGYGGNQDRRILEYNFLNEFENDEVIRRYTDFVIGNIQLLNKEATHYLKQRLYSSYAEKYLPVISGRKKEHKFNCILFRERFNGKINRNAAFMAPPFYDTFMPLLMDSFQVLLFNTDRHKLVRQLKQSLYHQLFQHFTNGQDKPIHFSSGLHWDANKLSRGIHRLRRLDVVQSFLNRVKNQEKMTSKVKNEFLFQNKSMFFEILQESESSFLWDYLDRKRVIEKFKSTTDYNDLEGQIIFQRVIPLLKLDSDDAFEG